MVRHEAVYLIGDQLVCFSTRRSAALSVSVRVDYLISHWSRVTGPPISDDD